MCGRYHIDDGRDSVELSEIIEAVNRRAAEPVKTSGDIYPTDTVPVVASSRSLTPAAFAMRWGYTLPDGRRIINARSETAEERPLFRDGMRQRRCAIPATNYYEWERSGGQRTQYAIRPAAGGLFYMAGLYRIEGGRPVILPSELVREWIDPRQRAGALLDRAVLDVLHERASGAEQLRMPL